MPKERKYEGQSKVKTVGPDGYFITKEVYYKKKPKTSQFYFDDDPKLMAYRAKAFAKPEPQAEEYYEGELDNGVKSCARPT